MAGISRNCDCQFGGEKLNIGDSETAVVIGGLSKVNQGFALRFVKCRNRSDRYFVLDAPVGSTLPANFIWMFEQLSNVLTIAFDKMVEGGYFTVEQQFDAQVAEALEDGFTEVTVEEYEAFVKKWREAGS
mgnify:CR=1 FL=1